MHCIWLHTLLLRVILEGGAGSLGIQVFGGKGFASAMLLAGGFSNHLMLLRGSSVRLQPGVGRGPAPCCHWACHGPCTLGIVQGPAVRALIFAGARGASHQTSVLLARGIIARGPYSSGLRDRLGRVTAHGCRCTR